MLNKKQKLLGYGVLVGSLTGAVLLGWLTLPATRGISGIPKQIKYQMPAGEQLVATAKDSTIPIDTELEHQGHRYRLDIKIDQPNISPLAGSFITGKIQLLKDGSPTSEVPDFMLSSQPGFGTGVPKDIPVVLVDLDALNQQMTLSNSYWSVLKVDDQLHGWGGGSGMFSWNRLGKVGFTKDGKPTLGSAYLYTQWDKLFTSPQALGMGADNLGILDLSSGQATFKYQTNGLRVASYLDLAISSYGKKIQSSKRVSFQDDRRVTVPQPTSNPKDTEVYYEIVTSKPLVTAAQTQRVSIGVVARKQNGGIEESPTQRVRLVVMPISTVFLPQTAQAEWSGGSPRSELNITGTIQINTAGRFIITDDIKFKYDGSYDEQTDLTTVELDLLDGKATIDFEYSGHTGPLPYLAITAQPADFSDWKPMQPAPDQVRRCTTKDPCPVAGSAIPRSTIPYHREAAGITYPPYPAGPKPTSYGFDSYPYSSSGLGGIEYFLYRDQWRPRDEFTDFVVNATAIKLLPISSGPGSSVQWAWWWFMSLQLTQLIIWLIKVIIQKHKQRHGHA